MIYTTGYCLTQEKAQREKERRRGEGEGQNKKDKEINQTRFSVGYPVRAKRKWNISFTEEWNCDTKWGNSIEEGKVLT